MWVWKSMIISVLLASCPKGKSKNHTNFIFTLSNQPSTLLRMLSLSNHDYCVSAVRELSR